jgi:ATP-dependent helicase/DNAse subunit B
LIACLRSPYLRNAAVVESDKDLLRLDRLSLEQKVVESRQQWLEMVTAQKDRFTADFPRAFGDFLAVLQPPAHGTLREFIVWAEDLFDRYLVLSNDSSEDQFQRWEEHRAVAEFRGCLADLLHEENICGAVECTPEFFLTRLNHLVEKSNFRRSTRHNDYVTICGADLAPNRSFEHVFILGLAEGEFPQKPRQTGFLSSDEIARWHSFGIDLRNPRFHPGFELALFRSLVQRARNQVSLSFPLFESSGEELMPSYFMTGGDESVNLRSITPFGAARTKPISARDALSSMLWHQPQARIDDARAMLPLTTLVESLSEPLYMCRGRAAGSLAGNYEGDLREIVGAGALKLPIPAQWSASRLNEYGKCPFRYWMGHVLRVEPQEEPEAGLDAMVLGETYHKALELFYSSLIARRLTLRTMNWEDASKLFQSSTNAALALLEQRTDVRRGEFWRYERNEIAFRLKRFFLKEWQRTIQDQDEFTPVSTEAGFGMHDHQSHPPVKIRRNGREIVVRGRIDRIDVAAQTIGSASPRVRVIDYKAGSTAITKDDAISGRNIQLPLYALAVQQAVMPGANVVAGQYLSISSGEPSGRLSFGSESRHGEEETNILDTVRDHIVNFVSGIECGDFSVKPNHQSVCKRCDHRSVCRIAEMPEAGKQPARQEGN